VDDFLRPIRALFRPGDPRILVDTTASRGKFVMIESHRGGCLADGRPYQNGKIYALREYFDSLYVVELTAPGAK
jgi:uncharacterized protein